MEILADRVGNEGSVVALDISPVVVAEARRRASARRNVEILLSSLEDFHMINGSYYFIICHQAFHHFEDKKKAIIILSKALKPDGTISPFIFINFREIDNTRRKSRRGGGEGHDA